MPIIAFRNGSRERRGGCWKPESELRIVATRFREPSLPLEFSSIAELISAPEVPRCAAGMLELSNVREMSACSPSEALARERESTPATVIGKNCISCYFLIALHHLAPCSQMRAIIFTISKNLEEPRSIRFLVHRGLSDLHG
jgi:hypothetical protein